MDEITPCYSIHWMDDPDSWGLGWYLHCDRCDQPIRTHALSDDAGDIGRHMDRIGQLIVDHHETWHGDEILPGAYGAAGIDDEEEAG